jgi:hypothetical protein
MLGHRSVINLLLLVGVIVWSVISAVIVGLAP